jgi:hypothetical protein
MIFTKPAVCSSLSRGERLVEFLFEQAHLAFCELHLEREFVGGALAFRQSF